jgi:hypothetical protein
MTICILTVQQLRRAAAIEDEIAELTRTLMELGKNVTQDDAVLPAINQVGMRISETCWES